MSCSEFPKIIKQLSLAVIFVPEYNVLPPVYCKACAHIQMLCLHQRALSTSTGLIPSVGIDILANDS